MNISEWQLQECCGKWAFVLLVSLDELKRRSVAAGTLLDPRASDVRVWVVCRWICSNPWQMSGIHSVPSSTALLSSRRPVPMAPFIESTHLLFKLSLFLLPFTFPSITVFPKNLAVSWCARSRTALECNSVCNQMWQWGAKGLSLTSGLSKPQQPMAMVPLPQMEQPEVGSRHHSGRWREVHSAPSLL